jgi:hypothetical protein
MYQGQPWGHQTDGGLAAGRRVMLDRAGGITPACAARSAGRGSTSKRIKGDELRASAARRRMRCSSGAHDCVQHGIKLIGTA